MGLFRHDDGDHLTFKMHEKLLSIGDDYWIETADGERAFKVDGKVARLRDTWHIEDRDGNRVAEIREKMVSVRDGVKIRVGDQEATVKKALVGLRDRFQIDVENGQDLKAHGNIVDHEYEIERNGDKVAEVSKKWFRVRDTYGIEIYDPTIVPLILAITVAVDALSHDHG